MMGADRVDGRGAACRAQTAIQTAIQTATQGAASSAPTWPPIQRTPIPRAPILVMAVGNLLRGDDGFAGAVLVELEKEVLPETVELFDAGTSIIDLMEIFSGRQRLIVIDAVRGGQAPGTLYRFSPEEVEAGALPMNSLHQVGLLETLKLGELVDCTPGSTVVIGVQPDDTSLGIGLSVAVQNAVPKAVRLVKKELNL